MKKYSLTMIAALMGAMAANAQDPAVGAPPPAPVDPGEMALKYTAILAKNNQMLREYSWQSRVEVFEMDKDERKPLYVTLNVTRLDSKGMPQSTELNKALGGRQRHGMVRGNIQERKLKSIKESVNQVKQWILSYVYMSRGNVVNFFDRARKSDSTLYRDAVVLQGTNVAIEGDSVSLHIDKLTGSPLSLTFFVPTSKDMRLSATVHFRYLRDNSAFYADQVDAKVWEKDDDESLNIKVENFDFSKGL